MIRIPLLIIKKTITPVRADFKTDPLVGYILFFFH
jgi:hypothetical protein